MSIPVKNRWIVAIIAAVIVVAAVFAIQWWIGEKKESIKDCKVTIKNVRITGFGFIPGKILPSTMNMEIEMDVYNPNDIDIGLYELEYEVYINEIFVGNGSLNESGKVDIPSNETRTVNISYTANLTVLPDLIIDIIQDAINHIIENMNISNIEDFSTFTNEVISALQNIIKSENIKWEIKGTAYVETPLGKSKFKFSRTYPNFI